MSSGARGEVAETLTTNLKALAGVDPGLSRRLHLPVDSSHLIEEAGRPPRYCLQETILEFVIRDEDLDRMANGLGSPDELFVFGISIGEQIEHLLHTKPDATRIIVWDRDPYLMRLALANRDFSGAIASGRLELRLGADLIDLVPRTRGAEALFHPFLSKIYYNELDLVISPSDYPIVLVALDNLFFDDLARTLRGRGHIPYPINVLGWDLDEIVHTIEKTNALYLVTINLVSGMTEFCERHALPLLIWEIDPCIDRVQKAPRPNRRTHLFTYRRANAQQFRQQGYDHVEYLPLGADTSKRGPQQLSHAEQSRYRVPLAFVGSSMSDSATVHRRRFLEQYGQWHPAGSKSLKDCEVRIQKVLDGQRIDYSDYRIPELAAEQFKDFLAATATRGYAENPVLLLAELAASEKRLAYASLLGAHELHIWGDANWRALEVAGITYHGAAGHNEELTKIYANTQINIDIGRLYQMDIVPMRVFDVLACGGFLIAEHSDALAELFAIGVELESYRCAEELVSKVAYYRANPGAGEAIASRARRAIVERHTITRRVDHMLQASGIIE